MSGMAIEKYIGKPRGFTRPSYRDLHTGKVTVDDKGRMFPFGTEEVNAVVLKARFHFFEADYSEPLMRQWFEQALLHKSHEGFIS